MPITAIAEPTTSPRNALIGHDTSLTDGDVVLNAQNGVNGGSESVNNLLTPSTYDRWRVSALNSGDARFEWSTLKAVNYVGIAAHNAGTAGAFITIYTSINSGSSWTSIYNASPTNDDAIFISFPEVSINGLRVVIGTGAADLKEIGVIYMGNTLEMQRPIYGGHSPADLNTNTEYQSVMSESGNFLGRTITSLGSETAFSWRHLTDDWVRDTFKPFIVSARTRPFFIKWRPDYYEDTAIFGFTTNDIQVSNMGGGHRLMNASFSMRGHADL